MTSPEFLFGKELKTTHKLKHYEPNDSKYDYSLGFTYALIGSLFNALVFLVCRKIGKDVHQSLHPFYFGLMSMFGGMLLLIYNRIPINPLTSNDIIMLSLCGILQLDTVRRVSL